MKTGSKLWFKAKKYGWGWYPVSWHGWLVLIVYLAIIIPIFLAIDRSSHSGSDTLINFALPFIGLTSLLLSICYIKGEWPHWQWGDDSSNTGGSFGSKGSEILKEIKKSKSILLHCHPSPDPDSVGSALATKFVLEQLGKKVTVIRGDSEIPKGFMHFPGAGDIIPKNFFEIDIKNFDLFIVLDSSRDGISRLKEVTLPDSLKVINIDHHRTNTGCGSINLIDPSYPANCLILYDLFKDWNIKLNQDIATNLFIGIYADTGGFKYEGVKPRVFGAAEDLAGYIPDLPGLISKMENSTTRGMLAFESLAFDSIKEFFGGVLALSSVPYSTMQEKGILIGDVKPGFISSILRSMPEWKIVGSLAETAPNTVKLSFRSSDSNKYDVSKLAAELGGGGHKAAAGAVLAMPIDEAIKKVVETAKIIYNF